MLFIKIICSFLPENLQAFTVFTIETKPNNRTVYKPCGHYNNSVSREPRNLGGTPSGNLVDRFPGTDSSVDKQDARTDRTAENVVSRTDRSEQDSWTDERLENLDVKTERNSVNAGRRTEKTRDPSPSSRTESLVENTVVVEITCDVNTNTFVSRK